MPFWPICSRMIQKPILQNSVYSLLPDQSETSLYWFRQQKLGFYIFLHLFVVCTVSPSVHLSIRPSVHHVFDQAMIVRPSCSSAVLWSVVGCNVVYCITVPLDSQPVSWNNPQSPVLLSAVSCGTQKKIYLGFNFFLS